MSPADTEALYRRYIDCLNERRLDDLPRFVHDRLTYNGEAMTLADYRELIETGLAAIPDLRFEIELLLTTGDEIACRLTFDCLPEGTFLGLAPTGRRVRFAEHVFYRLRQGRIEAVSALIDKAAIAEQLARG